MTATALYGNFFYSIYDYREYLKESVFRDLRKKYKRSSLGYLWSMLNPLLMMIILSVVFSSIMKGRIENYAVFLFCALLPWTYFNGTVKSCIGTIRQNAKIIDQLPIPKYIFSVSSSFYNFVDLFLAFVPLILVMWFTGHPIPKTIVLFPVMLIPLFFFSMGLGLLLAVSNVFFEDTAHLTDVLLRAMYFLCPILYARDMLPPWLVKYVVLNPMFGIIEGCRELLYYGTFPDPQTYLLNLGGSIVLLGLGLYAFNKADDKFVYFI